MKKRALCVGVNGYKFGSLAGCVADAESVAQVLAKHDDGSPNFDCKRLLYPDYSKKKTELLSRPVLRVAVKELLRSAADMALLYFAGHGTINDLDGYLVTQDAQEYDEGLAMSEVLKLANASPVKSVVIVLDCCHSGSLGSVPGIDNEKAILREGLSILTASRANETAAEEGGAGIFTSLVVDALHGGAADILGHVTAPAVYAFVESALGPWEQRPLFKSHVAEVIPLRKCRPPIGIEVLRALPELFADPKQPLPLEPSFVAADPSANTDNVATLHQLEALLRVHLVEVNGATDLTKAALQNLGCELTATGRHYWRLAKNARI